jgi:hypothetical protein
MHIVVAQPLAKIVAIASPFGAGGRGQGRRAWSVAPRERGELRVPTTYEAEPRSAYLMSISCATTSECTAVDSIGQEVTFNPRAYGKRHGG